MYVCINMIVIQFLLIMFENTKNVMYIVKKMFVSASPAGPLRGCPP